MPRISIRLAPSNLENPDADLRYILPDSIADASGGSIRADGYDYEDDDEMIVFLEADDRESALDFVRKTLATVRVLGNSLGDVAKIGVEETGTVKKTVGGLPHFASVTLELHADDGTAGIRFRVRGRGFRSQGQAEVVPEVGYDDWKEGAARGVRFALDSAGMRADVTITEIVGMTTDTNPAIVALAAARAVWLAGARHPDPETIQRIEHVAFSSWKEGPSHMPDLR